MIGRNGERRSGISAQAARDDDDDDVFFSSVNPEQGIIPSGQLNYSNFEYLNIPDKDLNVNVITEQQFL